MTTGYLGTATSDEIPAGYFFGLDMDLGTPESLQRALDALKQGYALTDDDCAKISELVRDLSRNADAHSLKLLKAFIDYGYKPSSDEVDVILSKGDAFSLLAFEHLVKNGYKPTANQVDLALKELGTRGLQVALEADYVPSTSQLDRWVREGNEGTYAVQLGYRNAVAGFLASGKYVPTNAQLQSWIKWNNQSADSAVRAAVTAGVAPLTENQRDLLLSHNTSDALQSVLASITPETLPSEEQIDRWVAPTYLGGRTAQKYGNIPYADPKKIGPLANYDVAVAKAVEAGYVLTPDQTSFIEGRANMPGLAKAADPLMRAL